jgi:hypothetical protein
LESVWEKKFLVKINSKRILVISKKKHFTKFLGKKENPWIRDFIGLRGKKSVFSSA